jgi:ABC-type antimicrobial peptide transport system permease subunit
MKDIPVQSNMQYDYLIPIYLMKDISFFHEGLGGTVYNTYVLLNENTDYQYLNSKIPPYIENLEESQLDRTPFLLPFRKVHLYDEKRSYIGVYTMGCLAILILITACINFINLSTARSFDRAKEVGIKKTDGAKKSQLIFQFLTEAFIITFISLLIALVLVEIGLPFLNRIFESEISVNYTDWIFLSGLFILTILTTILSGLYPAFLLSSFNPVKVLQKKKTGKSGGKFRKILVVLQFSIAILTILCTVIMVGQLRYMKTADLGFNKDNILIIPARGRNNEKFEIIKNELIANEDILSVTTGSDIPDNVQMGEIEWGHKDMIHENQTIARIMHVGYDFDRTFELTLKDGRFFSKDHITDSTSGVIINQDIADIMGYKEPVGQPFFLYDNEYTIIGVVEDFKFFPLNLGGNALFMVFSENQPLIFLRYRPGDAKIAIEHAQKTIMKYNPNYPFEYYYYNDYDRILTRIGDSSNTVLIYFSLFGILISCLGLLGLAIFSAETKTKEIGIRKAFGASIQNIIGSLSREFMILILIAHLIAIPIAFLIMNFVLNLFAVKTDMSIWYFILTAAGVYILAFITTGWQTISAARKNPVDSLRYE